MTAGRPRTSGWSPSPTTGPSTCTPEALARHSAASRQRIDSSGRACRTGSAPNNPAGPAHRAPRQLVDHAPIRNVHHLVLVRVHQQQPRLRALLRIAGRQHQHSRIHRVRGTTRADRAGLWRSLGLPAAPWQEGLPHRHVISPRRCHPHIRPLPLHGLVDQHARTVPHSSPSRSRRNLGGQRTSLTAPAARWSVTRSILGFCRRDIAAKHRERGRS